ncbi:selenoprotein L [Fundulus diaphanus]
MAEDVGFPEETLTRSLRLLVSLGQILLQNAQQEAAASLETFLPHKITTLFGLITAGGNFYRSIGVKTKGEAEAIWQKLYHRPAVREQVEELLKLENEWDSFLQSVDKGLQLTDEQLPGAKTADSLSPDSLFTGARSGQSVTLGQFLGQGQKLLLVLLGHFGWLP